MDTDSVLKREKAFYEEHKAEFHKKYLNKWLVITGESLLGAYDTTKEAVEDALKHCGTGEFMLHKPARDDIPLRIGPNIRAERPCESGTLVCEPTISVSSGDPVWFPYDAPY